jgi:cytochrome c peroxidase
MPARIAATFGLVALEACSSGNPAQPGADGSTPMEGGLDDPDPVITDAARAALALLSPAQPPAPGPDASNHWADDPRAALFGRRLFFETGFSGKLIDGDNDGTVNALGNKGDTGKVACAGCHLPMTVFSDSRSIQRQTSLAAGWGLRRAPSLLDVGQSRVIMWDGRHDALYNQVFGPIESAVEMNSSRLFAAAQVFSAHRSEYEAIFGPLPPLDDATRFPPLTAAQTGCDVLDDTPKCTTPMRGTPGDGAAFDGMTSVDKDAVTRVIVNVGKAIGAYERLLSCGTGSFDRWMRGDASALTRAEQRGAALFVGKGRCAECHGGPFLSDEKFHNVGLQPSLVASVFIDADDPGASEGFALTLKDPLNVKGTFSDGDDGRLPSTIEAAWLGAFRTPRLRCVSKRPSFMHTGQHRTLDEVISFFNRGGDSYGYPGTSELTALGLTARERADLVAFMGSLDGPGPSAELLSPP